MLLPSLQKPVSAADSQLGNLTRVMNPTGDTKPLVTSLILRTDSGGCLYLSQAPGKVLPKGRDGKSYCRDLAADLRSFLATGITAVVCLLNQYELRTLGVDLRKYREISSALGIVLVEFPMVEMAAPDSLESFENEVMQRIASGLLSGQSFLVHCRGGIGRSGLVAACVLLKLGIVPHPKAAIEFVRGRRDRRCVESRKQEDFIAGYYRDVVCTQGRRMEGGLSGGRQDS